MQNALREYREEKGLTQQAIADALGISRAMVGFLETGEREFTADMALLIEEKLGIPRAKCRPDYFEQRAA